MKAVLLAVAAAIALSGSALALGGVNGTSFNLSGINGSGLNSPAAVDLDSLHLLHAAIRH